MKTEPIEQLSVAPLTWMTLAFLSGIVLASQVTLPWQYWLIGGGVLLALALVIKFLRPQTAMALLIVPTCLCLGAVRYTYEQPPAISAEFIAYYNDRDENLYVTGVLAEPPDVRDTYMNLRLNVTAVDSGAGDMAVSGTILVKLTNDVALNYGDPIRVRGRLETPPADEEFSYRDYLARQGIYSLLKTENATLLPFGAQREPFWEKMYQAKARLLHEIAFLFPQPESAFLSGVLLGIDNGIPADIQQAFKNTGTAHVVAISGFNIAIVAAVFVALFSRLFGKKIGAVLAVLGIVFYTLLVGASASVVRAAIMGIFSILARQVGRRNLGLNTLAAVAALMAIGNPFILWDVGFQLSFAATLGLVLYAQPLQDAVKAQLNRFLAASTAEAIIGPFSDYFLLTLAAQLTTLPIIVYHFGRISLSSFITNPFILPAQPPVMIFGGLAAVAGVIYHPLGQVLAWFTWPFLVYTLRVVEYFGTWNSWVWVVGDFSLLTMLLLYTILFLVTLFWFRVWSWRGLLTSALLLTILGIFTVNLWRTSLNGPDGKLHLTLLEVGSAETLLIKTPDGRFILINGGPSPSKLADQLGRRLPPFRRKLDALVIAAPQENQVAALPRLLDQYPPETVYWSGNAQASYSATLLDEWLADHALLATEPGPGDVLDLGSGATLNYLAVSPRGAVLSVEWGNFKVILPLGVNYDTFETLENGRRLGPTTAVVLTESGYAASNPTEWLANLNPQMFLISVDAGDYQGRPSPDLLKTLQGADILRTDIFGWIDLTTDGQEIWVSVERK